MFVDEFYFHRKRGLGLWERVGHPLDTLTVLFCFIYLLFGGGQLTIYFLFVAFSCLFITKDEFIHREECSGGELWLHAILFVLHPVVLSLAFYLVSDPFFYRVVMGQFILACCFLIYQTIYWNGVIHVRKQ